MLHKRSFKPAKCKTALNLAKSRIKLMKNKKDIQLKQLRREVAQLLESGQDQTARIRVEHVVREEKTIAAYEMIEIYCELAVARLPIIESQKTCPLDLKEAIASLIFAAPRCGDITELQDIRKHFTGKYGKEFASAAVELRPECGVSRTLIEKLSVKAPDGPTKVKILTAIAEEHNIKWEPNWFKEEEPEPSVEMPKVAAAPTVEGNKIQMLPFNFKIADDVEDKQAIGTKRPGTSSQSHTSRLGSSPLESSSEKIGYNQSSEIEESVYVAGRPKWNMEFKDATAAAQAAAESAELASMAARAAAELASRSNVKSDYSSGHGFPYVHGQSADNRDNAGSGLQHSHVHRNSISGSFNQRSPTIQDQEDAYAQGNMTGGDDATILNNDYAPYKVQSKTGKLDFTESTNSRSHTGDYDSNPIISKAEPIMSGSSYFQEYENESSENPFHEETTDRKHQPSSFQSMSSTFGDDYGVFANSNYDQYKNDSGDGSLGSFSRNTADQEDWHVKSSYMYGEGDMTSKYPKEENRILESDERYRFDSGSDIFVGMDRRGSDIKIDEKGSSSNAGVLFDASGSDDDDEHVLYSEGEGNLSSPGKPMHKGSSLTKDNPHCEPDLSKSFKNSSIYSKLIEPMPVTFDDSDGANSRSEKERHRERSDPGVLSYDYQESDRDRQELIESYVEKGTADSFMSRKHSGSISRNKSDFDHSDASQPSYDQTSSAGASTDFPSLSGYGFVEGGPQKSFQSLRHSESQHPASEFEDQTQPRSGGGMELNLGALPGGRRNRAHLRMPKERLADTSFSSRYTVATPNDTFGSIEPVSTFDNKQIPTKMSPIHTHFKSPGDDDDEVVIAPKGSNNAEGPNNETIDGNVWKTRAKDPTGYFDSDDSSPEEDFPKPVVSKNVLGAGISRRTKTSAPRSVASSQTSVVAANTGRSSSSYTAEVSSSRITDQSNRDVEANSRKILDKTASKDEKILYSSGAEKPMTPRSPNVTEASILKEKAPSRENSTQNPGHVHPKLPDFETFTAHLQSLRKNR